MPVFTSKDRQCWEENGYVVVPEAVPVAGKSGDLVLWRTTLPHRAGVNTGERPRVAQYISMGPAPEDPHYWKQARSGRINGCRHG